MGVESVGDVKIVGDEILEPETGHIFIWRGSGCADSYVCSSIWILATNQGQNPLVSWRSGTESGETYAEKNRPNKFMLANYS